jgi:hypothetical protein
MGKPDQGFENQPTITRTPVPLIQAILGPE